ncbi:PAS domain S-box protein [Emcibacter sp. SYSU 3D8]|uniref:PAS domain S-box protein n=1 Tax=Emcibacter sp. SYSU 3D8 TaxID=3133969 RepID=UPI0031FE65D1
MAAPHPPDESARLEALRRYGVLDTPPEQAFDDLTALAARICAAPMAMVSLVDATRQWLKSSVGVPYASAPRDTALCAYAILGRDVFVVPDIAQDVRFASPPAGPDAGIRFYAGAPLITGDGHALGTLCVADRVPRQIDDGQRAALLALGRQVMAQLELHRHFGDMAGSRLAAIVESSNDAILAKDMNSIVTDWNEGAERLFGYKAHEIVGSSVLALIPPSHRDEEVAVLRRIRRGERIDNFTTTRLTRDGRTIDVSITASPVKSPDGQMIGASIIARDITAQIAHERELERVSRLHAALTEVNQAIVATGSSGELCGRICSALVELGGFRMAWIGWRNDETGSFTPVAQCGDDTGLLDSIQVFGDDGPHTGESDGYRFRFTEPFVSNDLLADPATRPWWPALAKSGFQSAATFPISSQGEVCAALCVYAEQKDFFHDKESELLREAAGDISLALDAMHAETQRERAAALAENERRFTEILIESMPGILYFYDSSGRFVRWNRNFETVSGYGHDEIALMHPLDFFDTDDSARVGERISEVFSEGDSFVEAAFLSKDGRRTPYYFTGRHVTYNGRDCLVGVGIDISERKSAEQALRDLNETLEQKVAERTGELEVALVRAESADRIKSAFLATMSHELRTPLNSIIGFTGILAQGLAGPLNDEQAKQLGMVRSSARHLLALINDVLDISKIEAGQLEVRTERFDLPAVLENVVDTIRPFAEKKGLSLTASISPRLGAMTSDRRRVEQIMLNLLNNAVKFTETGGVTLVADLAEGGAAGPVLTIRVRDSGIGIAAADLATLFQPFRQIDTGLARQHEGTGLGLAICRRLAALLGGDIAVDSEPGRGSVFSVVLPLERKAP